VMYSVEAGTRLVILISESRPQSLRTGLCQRFLNWGQSNLSRWLLASLLNRTEKAWSDPDRAAPTGSSCSGFNCESLRNNEYV